MAPRNGDQVSRSRARHDMRGGGAHPPRPHWSRNTGISDPLGGYVVPQRTSAQVLDSGMGVAGIGATHEIIVDPNAIAALRSIRQTRMFHVKHNIGG